MDDQSEFLRNQIVFRAKQRTAFAAGVRALGVSAREVARAMDRFALALNERTPLWSRYTAGEKARRADRARHP